MLLPAVLLAFALATPSAAPADPPAEPQGSWPLQPRPAVVEGFDPPESAWGAGHRGVDLAGVPGQQVYAALGGTVSFAGSIAGKAVVVVDHGATRTTYEPVAAGLPVGSAVAEGQPLGTLVLPASHCLPAACLHWGWKRGETYLDPLQLVGALPVRLLPLAGLPAQAARVSESAPWRTLRHTPPTSPYAGWSSLLRLLRPGIQP